jgi:hypothetical protein
MSDVTRILGEIEAGDPSAAEHLLPLAVFNHEDPGIIDKV